jgi:NAD(P)-dependent dehydrogenase (short-subunit alcohol dehydrogenase family)
MLNPGDMAGRAAVVTGAASGLGKAVALAIARAGADVAIVDVNKAGLDVTADEIRTIGVQVEPFAADISTPGACRAAIDHAVGRFGRLDALCNVAGIVIFAHSAEMAAADWERTIAVNLSGPFFLTQAAIPHLLASEGAIVNVTSQAGVVAQAYSTAYSASKAALNQLTRALAMEYMHKPIRINAVAPGGMATNIPSTITFPPDADFSLIQRFSGMRGMVEVDEVAQMVAYLASPLARGFHGAVVCVDHGVTAG